ncbi:PH domain-containing protein [Saccharopolyspora cebuensis]|uniref:PH domain-containing protein n=1 Tax=Saccharopolyspora cebuensis TaxID=418759 RepID=A0ABV4CJ51_9PSEU
MSSSRESARSWSPPLPLVLCGWVFALVAALWWLSLDAAVDRLFVGTMVVVLVAAAAFGSWCRPRLTADDAGLLLRGITGARRLPWSEVTVRVRRDRRIGRTVEVLELDLTDGSLFVLTRLDLGADPADAAEELAALRP